MKELGYKKYAKLNYLDEFSDKQQRELYTNQQAELLNRIKSAKHFANKAPLLSERLDNIDTSNMSYRNAIKLTRQYTNDWLNDTINSDPTID